MKIIQRHIGLVIVYATLLVLLVLVGLQIFIGFIAQLSSIGTGSYGVFQALIFVLLTLPKNVYSFFPMVGLLGSLLGLGYLASNSELIVMRASGMSLWQITWTVLKAAILLLIIMTVIGELVSPFSNHMAMTQKAIAKSGANAVKTIDGLWMRKQGTFINIKRIQSNESMQGVSQYVFDENHRLISASYAQGAIFQNGQWLLQNIEQTNFNGHQASSLRIPQQGWSISINPDLLNISEIDPNEISLVSLQRLIHFQHIHGLQVASYSLVFWQRIFQPLATIVMIFLAIPFIFGPLRSSAMGSRILIGVVVGFAFYLLNQFFGPFSVVYQISPIVGAMTPILLFTFIAIYLLSCRI